MAAKRSDPEAAGWRIDRQGARIQALGPGIDRRHLRRLVRGEAPMDWELDLHGLTKDEARRSLEAAVADAVDAGVRGLVVIHGRGRHSDASGPVLPEAVPRWLMRAPCARWVLAFATAQPEDGGEGSLAVLLRRRRDG